MGLHQSIIVNSGNDIVIYNGVTGSPKDDSFSFIEETKHPVSDVLFSIWTRDVELMGRDLKRITLKAFENVLDGYGEPVHSNEGVRNYLLKLGIKEYE